MQISIKIEHNGKYVEFNGNIDNEQAKLDAIACLDAVVKDYALKRVVQEMWQDMEEERQAMWQATHDEALDDIYREYA